MAQLTQYVVAYGLPLIFGIVLLEQLGAPIPAIPVLIVAGALSVEQDLAAWQILLVAVAASVIADSLWYALGRFRGNRILKTLCRISLSPDSCVRQTESVFERWGMPSLLFAKFIPGF
jgi:membrane protein DedA with SNARE-associated domain